MRGDTSAPPAAPLWTAAVSDRIRCCVPFCRRTTGEPFREWICAKHWSMVPRTVRAVWSREKRQARRIIARKPIYREYWNLPPGASDRLAAVRLWRRYDAAWERCKTAAIEAAAGVG